MHKNEKRLIDANVIPESAIAISTDGRLYVAWSEIVKAPTVDAVEVVHARWENGHCTNCKQNAEVQSIGFNCTGGIRIDYKETNYCPNCGAKMDKEN